MTGRTGRKSSSEASDKEDTQNAKRDTGTGRRRRSVRFKYTMEDKTSKGGEEDQQKGSGGQGGDTKQPPGGKTQEAGEKMAGHEEFEAVWDQALSEMVDEGRCQSVFLVIQKEQKITRNE